ncbi:MAG: GNAT family N-acetyltransferase [Anaerolineales bacterium]|nr:GNAT family N-acetyltransferase [Anaerolineales bacterium]
MIRLYKKTDTEAIIDVWYQASLIAHSFLTEDFLEEERVNLRELFLPNSETWVKEIKGEIVGFISLMGNEVGGLFVHPAWQRQGVGVLLMDKARSLHKTLELDVFEANLQGRAFYSKYGFELVKKYKDQSTDKPILRLCYTGRSD